ncbi:hypothetical protein JCM8547_007022 [Rhodosporidiobolus lusitaniae]
MLDRLPPELVDHVLDQLPSPIKPERALEQQNTLWALSLSCRRLYNVIRPRLCRDVFLDETRVGAFEASLATAEGAELAGGIRTFTFVAGMADFTAGVVQAVLSRLPAVEEIRLELDMAQSCDLSCIEGCKNNLRKLTLARFALSIATPPTFTLPCLVELTLSTMDYTDSVLSHLLSPSFLPSLRHLALNTFLNSDYEEVSPVDAILDYPILPQLSTLHLIADEVYTFHDDNLPSDPNLSLVLTTIDSDLDHPFHSTPYHLRYISSSEQGETSSDLDFTNLDRLVDDRNENPPKSLHLPERLRRLADNAKGPLGFIVAKCGERGVEVKWYEEEDEEEAGVSRSFCRFVQEKEEQRRAVSAQRIAAVSSGCIE